MPERTYPIGLMGRWITSVRSGAMPDRVRHVAGRAIIDTIGVSIAGSTTSVATRVREIAVACGGPGHATVFGASHAEHHATTAALANGAAAHALDFDDNCYAGFVHGSAVVFPTALAIAQELDLGASAMIDAYIVGVECEFALATALGRSAYDQGWWTTSLFGSIGACAAACHAMRLDAETTQAALGLAVVGASGAKAGFGTDAKPILVGRTAQSGIVNALLAKAGCSGPPNAVEADNGLAGLVGDGHCDIDAFATLGQTWRLLAPGIDVKRIPVCLASHAAVEALKSVLDDQRYPASIERIVCDVPPVVMKNLPYALPGTPQQAQFSMSFAMAATVLEGDVARTLLQASVLQQPAFIAMMRRVDMVSTTRWDNAELARSAPEGAWVRVQFSNGVCMERFCAMPLGSGTRPLSDRQLDEKFTDCVTPVWGAAASACLLERLHALNAFPSTRLLFDTAVRDGLGDRSRRN